MKRRLTIIIIFVFASGLFAQAKQALFIGNSITYYNNIPQKFKQIADAFGDSVDVTLHTPGGTGFGNHVISEVLYEKIRQGIWDYVIMQPGSGESPGTSTPPEITLERIETILDSVYYYNPYAQPLFYEISCRTWGHSEEELLTYNETMDAILANVQYWADNTETFLAPVGESLRSAWNQNQETLFWLDYDEIHLNERGAYVAACVFYATIFQKPSLGSEFIGELEAEIATECQELADEITLNDFPEWRINSYNFWVDFQIEQNMNELSVINNSANLEAVFWDFGDGTTSEENAPEHTYQEIGTYQVTLAANVTYNSGAEAVVEKSVEIEVTDLIVSAESAYVEENRISIYPNPFSLNANKQLNISFSMPQTDFGKVAIYNVKGQQIITLERTEQHKYNWNGKDQFGKQVGSGIYFIKASSGKYAYNKKIMVIK